MRFWMSIVIRAVGLLLAGSLAVDLAGCGPDDAPPADNFQVQGRFTQGDAELRYVATFVDSTLVKVEEEQTFGEVGRATAVYEVQDGRLVYYQRDESRRRVGTDESGHEQVELELEFDDSGRLVRAAKLVDGEPTEMLGYEAPGAQRQFAELRRRAEESTTTARAGMR